MLATSLPLAAVVFVSLWLVLSTVISAIYPVIKGVLPIAPKPRATILLLLCTIPLLASVAITVLEFTAEKLVEPHCHAECAAHVPVVPNEAIGWGFLILAAFLLTPALFRLCRHVAREKRLARLLGAVAPRTCGSIRLIDSNEPLAFCAGVFAPTVFVSQGLVRNCSSDELQAIVEHEQAHGRRHDNLQRWMVSLGTFPSLSRRRLLSDFRLAAEQCCDDAAARTLGDPLLVAHVLVKIQRLKWRNLQG